MLGNGIRVLYLPGLVQDVQNHSQVCKCQNILYNIDSAWWWIFWWLSTRKIDASGAVHCVL